MVTFGKVLRAGALAAGMFVAGTAQAQSVTLGAVLNGAQERPNPVTTTGFGFGQLTYNQAAGTIAIMLQVSNLTSATVPVPPPTAPPATAPAPAHVHLAPPTANGPIVIPITLAPVGQFGFNVMQTFTFADLATLGVASANVTLLRDELNRLVGTGQGTVANLYFNVHTSAFPGGEIRGNLAVVPEPSTYALLGTGLAGLGVAARRRRQRA